MGMIHFFAIDIWNTLSWPVWFQPKTSSLHVS